MDWRKKAGNMKLQLEETRVGERLVKGSKEHEPASKSNESKRAIRERKQET